MIPETSSNAMSSSAAMSARPVALSPASPRVLAVQMAFLAAMVAAAYVRVPLPGTPVPLTLQVFVALSCGLMLGLRAGIPVLGAYLSLGILNLPVFSGGAAGFAHFAGPTGGYLAGFFVACAFVGWLIADRPQRSIVRDAAMLALGVLIIHGMGVSWLSVLSREGFLTSLVPGSVPFVIADAVKAVAAYSLYLAAGPRLRTWLAGDQS